jgi:hypothetical protein
MSTLQPYVLEQHNPMHIHVTRHHTPPCYSALPSVLPQTKYRTTAERLSLGGAGTPPIGSLGVTPVLGVTSTSNVGDVTMRRRSTTCGCLMLMA